MTVQHIYKELDGSEGLLYAWFSSMYTRVDVALYGKSEKEFLSVIGKIYAMLCQLEKAGSFYDPDSELYTLNQTASESPVAVSEELYTVIDSCLDYRKKTLGCFDITIQSDDYNENSASCIVLSPGEHQVFYKQPGIRIDLSGFLKGYALEKTRTILQQHDIENAIINMGNSSVLAMGSHPHGEGWKVSFGNTKEISVTLHNQCLTTSGNETSERKHIVSPHTGQLIEGERFIAVVTDDGITGEVLSTSLFIATPEEREEMMKTFEIKEIYEI